MRCHRFAVVFVLTLLGCTHVSAAGHAPTISIIGTNDLHGHIERLSTLASYIAAVRAARKNDGAVVLVDAGDLFQGTLESNLNEGAPVIAAYNALGYVAAAVGNHEFDYGPVGPDATPQKAGEDPLGALRARMREATFPFLSANITRKDGSPPFAPSIVVNSAGAKVGIVGLTTVGTPSTTNRRNLEGLSFAPLASSAIAEATKLRAAGADIIIVVAHAGSSCTSFADPHDVSSCKPDQEITKFAAALPAGLVDAIVAGHVHAGVAQYLSGIPVIESYSLGRAFGRIDLTLDAKTHHVAHVKIFPPEELCEAQNCAKARYEGARIVPSKTIDALLAPAFAAARALTDKPLGVTVTDTLAPTRLQESILGDLVADLVLQARPAADIAITNAGGIRAALPKGALTYGDWFALFPFDNQFADVRVLGRELRALMRANLQNDAGLFFPAGFSVEAKCDGARLDVTLRRKDGRIITDDDELRLVTSDFLARGGAGFDAGKIPPARVTIEDAFMRDKLAEILAQRHPTLSPADTSVYDPKHPRLRFLGTRPIHCEAAGR